MEVGRALCQLASIDFFVAAGNYFLLDLLNVLFGLVAFFVASRQPNMVVDMNDYLVAMHSVPSSAYEHQNAAKGESLESLADSNDEVSDIALLDGGTMSDEDLRALSQTFNRHQGKKTSRFVAEQKALADYNDSKRSQL